MPLVLKICGSDWNNASRDKRELSAYRELGCDVLVMAKGEPGDRARPDEVDGFPVLRYSTRPLGTHVPNAVNRVVSIFQWAREAASRRDLRTRSDPGSDDRVDVHLGSGE